MIFDNKTIKDEDISPQVFVDCMNQTRNKLGVLFVFFVSLVQFLDPLPLSGVVLVSPGEVRSVLTQYY